MQISLVASQGLHYTGGELTANLNIPLVAVRWEGVGGGRIETCSRARGASSGSGERGKTAGPEGAVVAPRNHQTHPPSCSTHLVGLLISSFCAICRALLWLSNSLGLHHERLGRPVCERDVVTFASGSKGGQLRCLLLGHDDGRRSRAPRDTYRAYSARSVLQLLTNV